MSHTHHGSFSIPSGLEGDSGVVANFSKNVPGASNLGLIATESGLIWGHDDRWH